MAFYDWNHNGKNDMQDDYIEYNIYKSSTGGNSTNYSSGDSSGCGCLVWCLIFIVLALIGS